MGSKGAYGEGYFPFNWELSPLIDSIWLSEGFIRFATLAIVSKGSLPGSPTRQAVLDRSRTYVKNSPVFIREMPLIELSRVGSTAYGEDFRIGRNLFMQGALLAEEIHEFVQRQTKGKKGFRDLMRYHFLRESKQQTSLPYRRVG